MRNSHGLWFIDNVAALMSLVKGTSSVVSLDQMAKVIHLGTFALRSQAYYEYVESKANWSDEISRLGHSGQWATQRGFRVGSCGVADVLLHLPGIAVCTVFSFL